MQIGEKQKWKTRDGHVAIIQRYRDNSIFPWEGQIDYDGITLTETWQDSGRSRVGIEYGSDLIELLDDVASSQVDSLTYFREKFFGGEWYGS